MWHVVLLCLLSVTVARSQTVPERAVALLQKQCGSCHGESMGMSDLRVHSRASLLKGGKRGPAMVAGDSEHSRLYQFVAHIAQPSLPPGKPLATEDVALLKEWIDSGAVWAEGKTEVTRNQWWSFQKPKRPAPPSATRNPIDAFIQAKLSAEGLSPAPEADRLALIRRATYDLHGLPPTAQEVKAFVEDKSPDADEKMVDLLLASPPHGERW